MNYFFVDYENVKNLGLDGIELLTEDDTVIIFYSQNANTITFETHKKICAAKARTVLERVNVGYKNALDFQLASYLGYIIGKTEGYDAVYHLVTNDSALSVVGKFWSRKGKRFSVIEKISDVAENNVLMPQIPQDAVKNDTADTEDIFAALNTDEAADEAAAADETAKTDDIVKITEVTLVDEPKGKKNAARKKTQKNNEVHDPELEMKLEEVLSDKSEIPVIVKIIKQYKTKQGINNALMKQFPSQNNQRSGEIYQAIKPLLTDKKGK